MSALLSPLALGSLFIPNRLIMSPLTRCRAGADRVPTALMAEYYRQRAGAGLIISEATSVSPQGVGYTTPQASGPPSRSTAGSGSPMPCTPREGGSSCSCGTSAASPTPNCWAAPCRSRRVPIAAAGQVRQLRPVRPYVTPRALATEEIAGIVDDFRRGAENAQRAGFDGVEIHAANGYLIDQFLQDSTNHRTDRYGGSVENRARFLLEITEAVSEVWGSDRVGVHLRPRGEEHDMGDSDPRCAVRLRRRAAAPARRSRSCSSARPKPRTACWATSRRLSADR